MTKEQRLNRVWFLFKCGEMIITKDDSRFLIPAGNSDTFSEVDANNGKVLVGDSKNIDRYIDRKVQFGGI